MSSNRTYLIVASLIILGFCIEKGDMCFKMLTGNEDLIRFFSDGWSIKCWECRSDSDPKCADPFDNSTLSITDCKQNAELDHLPGVKATMCRKIRQKVNGEWRYFRSCAYMGEPGIVGDERFCLMRTGTFNIFMEYCTCNSKDGCNSSAFVSPKLIIIYSATVFSLAFKFITRVY